MTPGVALIWDVTAPGEAAAAFLEGLAAGVPALSPRVSVALHPRLAVVHLHFKSTGSPVALSRLETQARQAGGRLLDLGHLSGKKLEDFRSRFLMPPSGEALELESFAAAAQAVRGALAGPVVRRPETLGVVFETAAELVREHSTNLSKGGLFIPTSLRPALNSQTPVTLTLPDGTSLITIARVVQLIEHPTRGGVGVALADPALSAALTKYLATLTPAARAS